MLGLFSDMPCFSAGHVHFVTEDISPLKTAAVITSEQGQGGSVGQYSSGFIIYKGKSDIRENSTTVDSTSELLSLSGAVSSTVPCSTYP